MNVWLRSSGFVNLVGNILKLVNFYIQSEFVAFVERFAIFGRVKGRFSYTVGPPLGNCLHLPGFAEACLHLSHQPALPRAVLLILIKMKQSINFAPQLPLVTC